VGCRAGKHRRVRSVLVLGSASIFDLFRMPKRSPDPDAEERKLHRLGSVSPRDRSLGESGLVLLSICNRHGCPALLPCCVHRGSPGDLVPASGSADSHWASDPGTYRSVYDLNPFAVLLGSSKNILFFGSQPDWTGLMEPSTGAFALAWLGYEWFMRTKRDGAR
jgi:hypothetical protein